MPAGPIPPNPSELLGSPRMALLFEQLKPKSTEGMTMQQRNGR